MGVDFVVVLRGLRDIEVRHSTFDEGTFANHVLVWNNFATSSFSVADAICALGRFVSSFATNATFSWVSLGWHCCLNAFIEESCHPTGELIFSLGHSDDCARPGRTKLASAL